MTSPSAQDETTVPISATRKRLPNCIPCRDRHLKCSKERPICTNCRRATDLRECSYKNPKRPLQFRNRTIRRTETEQARGVLATTWVTGYLEQHQEPPPVDQTEDRTPLIPTGISPSDASSLLVADTQVPSALHTSPAALSDGSTSHAHPEQWSIAHRAAVLSDTDECDTFDFYVRSLGFWLDIGSPNRCFQCHVPQLAMSNSLLLSACVACASQILALQEKIDPSLEEKYSCEVLELLIPLLSSDQATTRNEALLATTVVLRMSEQFLEVDGDFRRHVKGAASLFGDGREWSLRETDLATASFWTYIRESIRVCFIYESAGDLGLANLLDRIVPSIPPDEACDEAWTNQITYLLLHTIHLCWGDPSESSISLVELNRWIEEWRAALPTSFRPWCVSESSTMPFPRVQYFQPWHAVAWQFYYTTKVMLSVYGADDQASTNNLQEMRRRVKDNLVTPTRVLCGLCMSSTSNTGLILNGSHLMAWCGQFLDNTEEQTCLEQFLRRFHEETKWPIQSSLQKLLNRWADQRRVDVDSYGIALQL